MPAKRLSIGLSATLAMFTMTALVTTAYATTEKVLHSFHCKDGNGTGPYASLIFDAAHNLYGTTYACGAYLGGSVFKLTPKAGGGWKEEVLHSFNPDGKGGHYPRASLVIDASGNLYGTTSVGGAHGGGTVFELVPKTGGVWTEKILHSFDPNGKGGYFPYAGLIFDASGNLYGTTSVGGVLGGGTAFELAPNGSGGWEEKVLHSFSNKSKDGNYPIAPLIFDVSGNLYGTTVAGGTIGYGIVFELTPKAGGTWMEKILHNFNPTNADGAGPYAGLVFDASGNLYGTTLGGGYYDDYGTVFELTPKASGRWTEKVLYSFNLGADGYDPVAGLVVDTVGNVYGTTSTGGAGDYGAVFELSPTAGGGWTENVLYRFNGTNGSYPYAGLIFGSSGNLYGTTSVGGGSGEGTAFEIIP
ncbi:MAG: choice-of-anchor tandem repeat GloVer-containing protein [Terriglobales bacterium]